MARDTEMDMALVVPLFEQGFTEDEIKEALAHCSTIDDALEYLAPGSTKAKRETQEKAPAAQPRRRMRKGAKTASVEKQEEVSQEEASNIAARLPAKVAQAQQQTESAAPTPDTNVPGTADQSTIAASTPIESDFGLAQPSTAGSAFDAAPGEATTPPKVQVRNVRVIEATEEGAKWWKEAAERWPKIIQDHRLDCARFILRPDCQEVKEYVNRVRPRMSYSVTTPSRKRPGDLEGCEGCGGSNSLQKKYRQDGSASVMGMVPTPSRSSVGNASCQSPAPAGSPKGSPQSMALNNTEVECRICCCDVSSWRAVELPCGHGWYCASCMLRHSEARLDNGATCIDCPECAKPLAERELRKLLPAEVIDRLLARSLEQAVSLAGDIRACPTPNCPMRVALDDDESGKFSCTICKKTSCLRCGRQPYHRGLTCEEFAEKVRDGGKSKKLQQAEESFEQWMTETGTKQCPTCRMGVTKENIQKQNTQYAECHKMLCRNCNTKFCFKCLAVLSDNFTCGCTIDAHGFIDPLTGKRMNHLDRRKKQQRGKH
eukprot:TRINITY_DN23116_c0_g4_i1.p1 TRINITY_DN23116_c0_g4~~TRINITY_DN23116_c0_g4_i1.p1  ORF type:complete len:544 (+),score=118.59 TRINITY_DN23116_c0_g4_i1:107-1738(+)